MLSERSSTLPDRRRGFFGPLEREVEEAKKYCKAVELTLHCTQRNDKILHASVHGGLVQEDEIEVKQMAAEGSNFFVATCQGTKKPPAYVTY
jgi:hypothetical protein